MPKTLKIETYYDEIPFNGAILESVSDTFRQQAQALQKLSENFDQLQYQKALSYMFQCRGHVIICGMGKSGHIGRKIAATLASTGTPSFYVHPAEAFHGDLGMITEFDVVILISNSGETDEVLQLIPSLKSFGNRIIAITGRSSSTMAKNSDAVLELSMDKETCPNNLAPTTSTTLTLAIGDALAIALMHKRGFEPNDFARFHPGGSLGRKLLTKVDDAMTLKNLPFLNVLTDFNDVIFTMTKAKFGLGLVVDKEKKLLGIITDGDLRRSLVHNCELSTLSAGSMMNSSPKTALVGSMLVEAEELMQCEHVKQIVIVDKEGVVKGVVEFSD